MPENTHENSQARNPAHHLEPYRWKPGQSGNPGGRPRRKPVTEAYKALLARVDDLGVTGAQALAAAILQKALLGDVPAAKEVTDRVEGTVRQAMDLLFGELTDEQLKDFLAAQYGTAGVGDAGGDEAGDQPAPGDGVAGAAGAGAEPVPTEGESGGAV